MIDFACLLLRDGVAVKRTRAHHERLAPGVIELHATFPAVTDTWDALGVELFGRLYVLDDFTIEGAEPHEPGQEIHGNGGDFTIRQPVVLTVEVAGS